MPLIKKSKTNPYGLSIKQQAVIADMVGDVLDGKGLSPAKSHKKIYNPNTPKGHYSMATKNINRVNFREALINSLEKKNIIGVNGKTEKKLVEGLDAKTTGKFAGEIDFKTRLAYIQELNKITGVYAPDKKESKTLRLNLDLTPEQLDQRIAELQGELKPDITP